MGKIKYFTTRLLFIFLPLIFCGSSSVSPYAVVSVHKFKKPRFVSHETEFEKVV